MDDGVYYAYGTGWICYKNDSGQLSGNWKNLGKIAITPQYATTNYWAPEVYKYNGAYYMFATYYSSQTGHRGCSVLKADSPEGTFVEITGGTITPNDWDAIDSSLYVDEYGQPWMIFVHEWTSTDDGVGRVVAAKLSTDLTQLVTEPIELFRADDALWSTSGVTDGCYMYRHSNGELLMLWSSFDEDGYCVGIARSDNGSVDGNWNQDKELLFSKEISQNYDGGHPMIFRSLTGQLYLSIHSPNTTVGETLPQPVFIPIREQGNTLVWDIE